MMRITLLLLYLFTLPMMGSCQEVVASDGNFSSTPQGSLSWTLGEMISETYVQSGVVLTQGFQQNYEDLLDLRAIPFVQQISVYPNPFADKFYLHIEGNHARAEIEIFNIEGRLIHSQTFAAPSDSPSTILLTACAPGTYMLRVILPESESQFTFPIIKTF